MPMGCQWSNTVALTIAWLHCWGDVSWDWQPPSLLGRMLKALPLSSATPLAFLLPQPPLRLCLHTKWGMQVFCINLLQATARYLHFASKQGQECQEQPHLLTGDLLGWSGTQKARPRGPRALSTHPEK